MTHLTVDKLPYLLCRQLWWQVQEVQRHVLQMLQDDYPELMYPAALGCLADLQEVIACLLVMTKLLAAAWLHVSHVVLGIKIQIVAGFCDSASMMYVK